MNGYDFDKTIYNKDSSIGFYFFLIRKKPYLFYHIFILGVVFILYKLKIKKKKDAKEKMFSIFKHFDDIDKMVEKFWSDRELNNWYLNKKQKNDVIISASPVFLLQPICSKHGIKTLIATSVDKKTGKLLSNNCYGQEKVVRYKKMFKNKTLDAFYTDSYSDKYMLECSKKVVIMKKGIEKEVLNEETN